MSDQELTVLRNKLKILEEKHKKFQQDLKDAIEQGDGLHDNALWQSAQDRFNANLEKMDAVKHAIRMIEAM